MLRTYARHVRRFSPSAKSYLAALFFQFMGQTLVWVLRNLYLKKAGYDEDFIGFTLSISSCGAVLMIYLLAGPMDRSRLKGFLVAASIMISLGLFGVALLPKQPASIMGFSLLTGMGLGTSQLAMPVFFMRHSDGYDRAYLFGVGQALMPLAGLITTLGMKGGGLYWGETFESVRQMMYFGGAMPLVALWFILRIRENEPDPPPKKAEDAKLDVRLGMKFWSTELIVGIGAGLTIPFVNLYFHNRFHVEPGDVGLFYAASQMIMFFAFLSTPVFATRWGPIRTILIFQLASIPFFFVMAFTTTLPFAVIAFLARQAMMNMVHPVSDHFLMEAADPRQRARINGIKQLCRRAAWIFAPAVSGLLIANTSFVVDGFTVVMLITIATYLIGSGLYWYFFHGHERAGPERRTKRVRS